MLVVKTVSEILKQMSSSGVPLLFTYDYGYKIRRVLGNELFLQTGTPRWLFSVVRKDDSSSKASTAL